MNPKEEWDDLLTIKRRHVSFKERIQQWKRQRQNILEDASMTQAGSESPDVKPTELKLVALLCDRSLNLPVDFATVSEQVSASSNEANILELLTKFGTQKFIQLTTSENGKTYITSVDYSSLEALKEKYESGGRSDGESADNSLVFGDDSLNLSIKTEDTDSERPISNRADDTNTSGGDEKDLVECILSLQSAKERENKKISEEILHLLSKPTAKELSLLEQFRSSTGHVQEFCQHGTREECKRVKQLNEPCPKLHFLKIIQKHTDESLGDCSFLNTCFHMDSCKYVHYKVEAKESRSYANRNKISHSSRSATSGVGRGKRANRVENRETQPSATVSSSANSIDLVKTLATATEQPFNRVLFPPQWIPCDLRFFDMSILGKFSVVMADPPWDIHMELPYGTMSDEEMRKLNIPCLQDEGLIFLWVTGRAMELARECLTLWGYDRCDELIWVKTNQLQRIIRTGRTGHWINHGKEHCLVGVKGSPKNLNRGLDCDVIVAEVRATSHKPDEIYGIIERLSPGTRKIELFGRQHNTQPNWVTLGNQLTGLEIVDPQLVDSYKRMYPSDYGKHSSPKHGGSGSKSSDS